MRVRDGGRRKVKKEREREEGKKENIKERKWNRVRMEKGRRDESGDEM